MHSTSAVLLILALNYVRGYPHIWGQPSKLNPVHSLFVKPSTDGVTGDLYVAATEDNGVSSQWVVDQPVNYLPTASASRPLPVPYPAYPVPHEDNPQKRAVVPPPSPPVQYAYAMPMPPATQESSPIVAYPYAYPTTAPTSETSTPKCESSSTISQYPYQFPYHYFYPQMLNAYTNAMSILKEVGLSDETASSVVSPMWPPASYAYPMYVMMDPSAWAQAQTTTTSTPAPASSTQSEETTE